MILLDDLIAGAAGAGARLAGPLFSQEFQGFAYDSRNVRGGEPRSVFENDNFNDLFGLPISLSQLAPSHQTAVLELASDSAGEIAALCEIVAPHYGVIVNVAPAHLEHFTTLDRLAREYSAL